MTTLLQINASLNNGNGQSSELANQFVTAFQRNHEAADLRVPPVPARHLTGYAPRRDDPQ
jgi:FMN-dependent NADH-azoreductase